MKIGILTFHCAHNYGAVLQCYALQQYIKNIGYEVYVIDYKPSYLKYGLFIWYNWISLNPLKCVAKIYFQIRTFSIQYKRFISFNRFIKHRLNIKKLDLSIQQSDIRCFILGSDQIWRKNHNVFDPIYFGNFKAAQGHKLISYAASMGLNSLSTTEAIQIQKWLNKFSKITVRETSLKSLLTCLITQPIDLVVDPTFLLNSQEWDKISIKPTISKPYILIYQVIEHPETYKTAYQVAQDLGQLEVIEIASKIKNNHINHQVIYDATPEEFIGWIQNARFIVTTSFHGTAFSLIFKKAFVCIKQNRPSDLRIESILSQNNLLNRFIDGYNATNLSDLFSPPVFEYKDITVSKKILIESIKEND